MLKKRAFTLIELMVVVAIIGVLAAILVPQVVKSIDKSKISRTSFELTSIRNAMTNYLSDVSSYPPSVQELGRAWGADVGLVDRGNVVGSHLSTWGGPYLQDWPIKTAWGGIVGCGAVGAYYVHSPPCWIDRDNIACNDNWVHMDPYCVRYPPSVAIQIDLAMDDGNPATGNMRLRGGVPEYLYYYAGEGTRSW